VEAEAVNKWLYALILRGHDTTKLKQWLQEANHSGVYALQGFVRILKQDLDAVQNAVTEPWSGGQTEGQINRLKTLKWSMYGRAGVDWFCRKFLPGGCRGI
jgi:transposase